MSEIVLHPAMTHEQLRSWCDRHGAEVYLTTNRTPRGVIPVMVARPVPIAFGECELDGGALPPLIRWGKPPRLDVLGPRTS